MVKNVLIGIFVLLALWIIVFIILFLHPSVGDEGKTMRVRFTDIDKVNIGTRVTFAGLPVGEVIGIEEIPDARTERISRKGDVYVYELTLRVDSGVRVYNTDEITIRTSGLLGERNIAIDPLPLKHGEKLYIVDNHVMYAEQTANVEDTLKQFGALSHKFELVLDDLHDTFDQLKQEKVVEKLSRTVDNVLAASETLNQPEKLHAIVDNVLTITERGKQTLSNLDAVIQNAYSLTEKAHGSWGTIDEAFGHFRDAGSHTKDWSHELRDVIHHVSQGEGTIGKLFVSDDLYLRLKSILHKGETTMNDINHYGLLFHSNKQWQRVNARRLNLLNRLSTPQQFTTYFSDELDRISTSLSRVSMVLDETQDCYPQGLLCNPEFQKSFSDLIRRTEGIEDSLKMYNEQMIEQSQECCYPAQGECQ